MRAAQANMPPLADEAEQSDLDQTWRSLLWIPPSKDELAEHVMLHLNDELAGLVEAADTPVEQDGTHSAKPEPAVSVPGEGSIVYSSLVDDKPCLPYLLLISNWQQMLIVHLQGLHIWLGTLRYNRLCRALLMSMLMLRWL